MIFFFVVGVVLTLPEYRLSLQLKIYESLQKEDTNTANNLLHVHKWINANMRNILDESDAILQPKYQLIYTVGNTLPLDGGPQRWIVSQALLKRVPIHMKRLYRNYGEKMIEFDPNNNDRYDVFTPCRILDESIFNNLKAALAEDFIGGRLDIIFPEIISSMKENVKNFLIKKSARTSAFEEIEKCSLNEQNTIMIISGLLRFEVLKLALTKRWRVNYGVDTQGSRKMAIPFKAKDVAADMSEFGHSDVAICFTQLSYYYSGKFMSIILFTKISIFQFCQKFHRFDTRSTCSSV